MNGTNADVAAQKAMMTIIQTLADAIRSLGTVPSGHLYASVMNFMDLHTFNLFIGTIERTGLITVGDDHLITWVGP